MSRKIITPVLIAIFILGLIGGIYYFKTDPAPNNDDLVSKLSTSLGPAEQILPLPEGLEEKSMGQPEAPITIIEYASLSCGHCAKFHNEYFPQFKIDLIDTGKVFFISRDFPLNAPAFYATKLARCFDNDGYFAMIDLLFKNQQRWATAQNIDQTLLQIARLAGMSEQDYTSCMGNKEKEQALVQVIEEARDTYEINSTPSFVIHHKDKVEVLAGAHPVAAFHKKIEELE